VASIGRRGWRQAKTSLTTKFDRRVTLPLADALERVTQLQDQVAELTDIVKVQVEMGNQTTELLGRLLATASSRLEAVEDSLRQVTAAGMTVAGSSESTENQPRDDAGTSSASEDPSQH
jgi:Fic family protein